MENDLAAKLRKLAAHWPDDAAWRSTGLLVGKAADEIERLWAGLRYILWVKDCGIDDKDETGKWVNFPAEERDLMYNTAKKLLAGEPLPYGRGGPKPHSASDSQSVTK